MDEVVLNLERRQGRIDVGGSIAKNIQWSDLRQTVCGNEIGEAEVSLTFI